MRHLLVWSATAVVTLAGCTRSPQDGPAGVAGRVSTTAPSAESANTRLAEPVKPSETVGGCI